MKKKGGVVETSWIGTAWEKKNPKKGNPSVNEIKRGLQDASIQELLASDNMDDNKYLEKAKQNRILVWESIF